MYTLRSVGVLSCAKMMGAIYGALGLLFLPIFLLGGFASMFAGKGSETVPGIMMMAFGILAPFIYGAMGFVMGAFMAWIYNVFARWLGGIQMGLTAEVVAPTTPPAMP